MYAFIPSRKKACTAKLDPISHNGYLVGYDSTNIFCVWLPCKGAVISSRDITFDETKAYNSRDAQVTPLLRQHIEDVITITAMEESVSTTSNAVLPLTDDAPQRLSDDTRERQEGEEGVLMISLHLQLFFLLTQSERTKEGRTKDKRKKTMGKKRRSTKNIICHIFPRQIGLLAQRA